MKTRFSKVAMVNHLSREIERYETLYKFTSRDGWSQVENRGEQLNRAYGAYDMLLTLRDSILSGYVTK